MQTTKIEYLTHLLTVYSGCLNWHNGVCGGGGRDFYCWAKATTERFPWNYPVGFQPHFYPERITQPCHLKKPARVGVAFMGDMFGDWVDELEKAEGRPYRRMILKTVELSPRHTFLFLTKCPWNLRQFNPWPRNAWVGATATRQDQVLRALLELADVDATVKFLSLEPLMGSMGGFQLSSIQWLLIGVATGTRAEILELAKTHPELTPMPYGRKWSLEPKEDWVRAIEEATALAGVPVFEKNNLAPLLYRPLRQEYPTAEGVPG